jgi:hypothetical protein
MAYASPSYISPGPGTANQIVLTLDIADSVTDITQSAAITLDGLQNITMNAANDVFTWTQLDSGSKKNVATTATNSLDMNIVLDELTFFGNPAATALTAAKLGVFNLSKNKTYVDFSLFIGDGVTISGVGYVTGLAPTVSADSPVWVTPITITVDGDYTVTSS